VLGKLQARILVVDDDEGILDSISKALKLEGYDVDVANTGKKAIEATERNFYNLALLDIRLPDMEGTQLLTAMKETTEPLL
jgi:DNA-binding response OmpR family regulator